MSYHGLDRPHSPAYYLFYKCVFCVALLGLIAFWVYATKSVDYEWRWNRIPQYFWDVGTTEIRSETAGTITKITHNTDGTSTVYVQSDEDDSRIDAITVPQGASLLISDQVDVYSHDILATVAYSKPGLLLEGLWVTVNVSIFAIVIGIGIGLLTGLCRLSDNPALRWGAITYIEIVRGSPLLVQIYLWYFVVGFLIDKLMLKFDFFAIPPLWYGVVALAVFTGAYVAEIVRAGIQSVHRGQMEAARSLGMTHAQAMRKVILPQAFSRILPPLAGQFISLIKDSSLLGVMGVREVTKATREASNSSLQALEMWLTCGALYLVLTFTLSLFVQYLEKRAVRR